jgi:hypothetical protein
MWIMSKRKVKPVLVEKTKPTEQQVENVVLLFKPNSFQLIMMKIFGLNGILTGNKERVEAISNVLDLNKEVVIELEKKLYNI